MIERIEYPTIETTNYEIDYSNNEELVKYYENRDMDVPEKDDIDIKKNVGDLTNNFIIWINGVQIEPSNIESLVINNNTYLPAIELVFHDVTGKLSDEEFPLDNSIISVFRGTPSVDSPFYGIKMDFKITDYNIVKGKSTNEDLTFEISAIININDFFLLDFESYRGTSFEVLRKLSKEMGLGFCSNITNTDDEMVWINPGDYRIMFMRDVVKRSYVSDDTFIFGYVDFQYNFNLIDINKQLNSDISQQMSVSDDVIVGDPKHVPIPLVLTNHPDFINRNVYIDKYTMLNSSTNINLTYGYRYAMRTYDILDKRLNIYELDAITEDNENSIVLKDNPDDDFLYENMVKGKYRAKFDSDNCHKNYLHSGSMNEYNLKFLQKLKMRVKLGTPNFGLYRFQKVEVELYNMNKPDSPGVDMNLTGDEEQDINKLTRQHDDKINNKLSGEWLITAIDMKFLGATNETRQELTLVKRELTNKYEFPRRKNN